MNAEISVFVTCVETIIYLSLYNLHDCTFKVNYAINRLYEKTFRSDLSTQKNPLP